MVLALLGQPDKMPWGYLRWTDISSRGSSDTPRHFMLQKPELSTGTDEPYGFPDPLACVAVVSFPKALRAFTLRAFALCAFALHAFALRAFTLHAFTLRAFALHAFALPAFTLHAFALRA